MLRWRELWSILPRFHLTKLIDLHANLQYLKGLQDTRAAFLNLCRKAFFGYWALHGMAMA